MTPRDALEKEANDHAMEHALRTLYYKTSKRDDFVAGYLQAAIAREQEIEFLKSKFRASVECLKMRDAEIAELRARVAELEGMVPKWCGVQGLDRLRALGWSVAARNWQDNPPMWLMVPPIPLPEGK